MLIRDFTERSVGLVRARSLYRAAGAIGRASYVTKRNKHAEWDLRTWVSASGPSRRPQKWRRQICDAVLAWSTAGCSFEEGRERVEEALKESRAERITARELLGVRLLVGSVGFFTLTEGLLERAVDRALQDFDASPSRWSARNAFAARLLRREVDQVAEPLEFLMKSETLGDPELVISFIELCRTQRQPCLDGDQVTIVGPGPIGALGENFNPSLPVCRVVMPGVTSWPKDDIVGGRAEIGYLNGHSTRWLSSLSPADRHSLVRSFSTLRIKRATSWESDYPSVSQVRRIKDLFLTGEPNMVPTAVVDQVIGGASRVYVTGTSFFVGAEPYRVTDRRHFYEVGSGSDSFGAVYDGSFERCYSHASHDQIVNRAVVRLLFDSGCVVGDELFTNALMMSDNNYLSELEDIYGRSRR